MKIVDKLTCKQKKLNMKYIFILFIGLSGATATKLDRLAASDKAGIASATALYPSYTNRPESPTESIPWHKAVAPVAFTRAKAFERLQMQYLSGVNSEIKQWLLYATHKENKKSNALVRLFHNTGIEDLDPSNPSNLTIFHRAKPSICEKYITEDRLGKCSAGIKPEICRIAQDKLKRCGIDPANVVISAVPPTPSCANRAAASAYSSPLNPGKYLLYISDYWNDRLDHSWPSISKNYKLSHNLQTSIAHEASHFLNRDYIHQALVDTYVPRASRPIARLHELRADLFSVFHSPMPLAAALLLAQDKDEEDINYSHRNSANWQELISDLRSLGLNENSQQIDV